MFDFINVIDLCKYRLILNLLVTTYFTQEPVWNISQFSSLIGNR